MTYEVVHAEAWQVWSARSVYRYILPEAQYAPDSPWPSQEGRFDNGRRSTLYTSDSASAAAAEFFRRRPELLVFQDGVKLRMFAMHLTASREGLDVRMGEQANLIGFPWERLRSSDNEAAIRYAECRRLADDVEDNEGIGIAHRSAAHEDGETYVLFGHPGHDRWRMSNTQEVATPWIEPEMVRVIGRDE